MKSCSEASAILKEAVISRYLKKTLDVWWIEAIKEPDFDFVEAVFRIIGNTVN